MAEKLQEPEDDGSTGELLLYVSDDGRTRLDVRSGEGTVWLSQALMAELFQTTPQNITIHLRTLFNEGEIREEATCKEYLQVRKEGGRSVRRAVKHYNLDAILAVGFRVRSQRGIQFRQWAAGRLNEYLVKGFTLDDERLKNPPGSGVPDHFDELLERIRDIRASERRMYLRVKEIFALAADYQAAETDTAKFFQIIQNKLHFAVSGKTASELIAERADHCQPNIGLTTWKGGVVRKGDVTVAKNYLREDEIDGLNRIVVMFLDYAEDQAKRRKEVFMTDWQQKLDSFLVFNDRAVLPGAGTFSREKADLHAEQQYHLFQARRRETLESTAEAEALRELEDTARKFSPPSK